MAIPNKHECLMIASGCLRKATEAQNPEWAKACALTARGYLELAKIQEESMNPEDEAHWSPKGVD